MVVKRSRLHLAVVLYAALLAMGGELAVGGGAGSVVYFPPPCRRWLAVEVGSYGGVAVRVVDRGSGARCGGFCERRWRLSAGAGG